MARKTIPWVTLSLIAAQILFFILQMKSVHSGFPYTVIDDFQFNWVKFVESPLDQAPTLISYVFLHGNWAHLIFNNIFFLFFGPTIERTLGHGLFFTSYLLWGAAAALTQGYFSPGYLIGSSGAIAGASGAFFVLYPLKRPALKRWPKWMNRIPAFLYIIPWFLIDLKGGFGVIFPQNNPARNSSVGYWAHLGGFLAGALTVWFLVIQKQERNENAST